MINSSIPVLLSAQVQLVIIAGTTLAVMSAFAGLYIIRTIRKYKAELLGKEKELAEMNSRLESVSANPVRKAADINMDQSESERFYRSLVQSAEDGISFYDRDWKLRYANDAFYSMIGLTKESYDKTEHWNLIHPDDRDYEAKRVQALLQSGFHDSELRLWHRDGYYVILSSRSVTVRDDKGEILGALNISRDVTRLKEVHEALIKANLEVEASNKLKSNFLANVSHEIRTPLNSVVGFSNLLLAEQLSDEEKNQYIEQITFNSEKLLQIIGDIIDLSRLESSQIEIAYEEASVRQLVREVSDETLKNIARSSKPLQLDVLNSIPEEYDLIFTDRTWLRRVLLHLLDNAVKFTLTGKIDLSCEKDAETLKFSIRDTGIGINNDYIEHIFRGFSQEIAGHHRPFEGLGVGLTLARAVVERLGGKITVESQKGQGSVFRIEIPYRPAGSIKQRFRGQEQEATEPVSWATRKCLIVDDNRDVLIYLDRILRDTGITVLPARSGFEALDILRDDNDIDIVLLDMQM
ncbi:MAG: ATP-binding protein, partial [Bacteroidales bacterium]|nr:ATP-binding protein [Bacteroidales bacterium]